MLKVEVETREVIRALTKFADDLVDLPVFKSIADSSARFVASVAPKRTGRMARGVKPVHRRNYASAVVRASYGMFVNYGTDEIRAREFLKKADRMEQRVYPRLINIGIDRAIVRRGLQ